MVLVEGVADVGATELAADDVGLALAAVVERAGLGGKLGLVAGPAARGRAALAEELVEEPVHDLRVEVR